MGEGQGGAEEPRPVQAPQGQGVSDDRREAVREVHQARHQAASVREAIDEGIVEVGGGG